MIKLDKIFKTYTSDDISNNVLSNVDVMFKRDTINTIYWNSGTGKTTLLHKYINSMDGRKLLVIDPDGMEWSHVEEIAPEKCGELKNGQAKIEWGFVVKG